MMKPGRARRACGAHLGEHLHAVGRQVFQRAVTKPVHVAQMHLAGFQRLARTDDDARVLGIEMDHVERLAGRDADAAALADRIAQNAVVAAEHAAVDVDDVAGVGGRRLQLRDDVGILALRHEAYVLAVVLVGHHQPHLGREFAHAQLRQMAEGKAQVVDLLLGGGEQEVALVAVGVRRPVQRPVRPIGPGADIVAGRQRVGAEILRGRQQIGEFDRLVAGDAGNGRLARDVAFGERIDHRLAEAFLVVEYIVGNSDGFGNAAGVVDILAGAAGADAVGGRAVVVELQRDAHDIVAFAGEQAGDDGRIDATRHGDDHAGRRWRGRKVQAVHRMRIQGLRSCRPGTAHLPRI